LRGGEADRLDASSATNLDEAVERILRLTRVGKRRLMDTSELNNALRIAERVFVDGERTYSPDAAKSEGR
jgi:hypothetical protein